MRHAHECVAEHRDPEPRALTGRRPRAAGARRVSSVTAASRITPVTMYWIAAAVSEQAHAVRDRARSRARRTGRSSISPRPPNRLVPPITAAAIASSRIVPPPAFRSTELQARREDHAAERGHDARDAEHPPADHPDVDAGAARRLGVAADRVDVTAEARARRDTTSGHHEHEDHEGDDRHALGQVRGLPRHLDRPVQPRDEEHRAPTIAASLSATRTRLSETIPCRRAADDAQEHAERRRARARDRDKTHAQRPRAGSSWRR